ncbi:hypothetical protein ES703_117916 [subsurface metagenome]
MDKSLATTGFTAPTLNIEGKTTRSVASHPRLRDGGKKLTNRGKGAGVGGWITTRGAPNRRLVNIDHLINMLNTDDTIAITRSFPRPIEELCQLLIQNLVNKGAFTTTRNPGDTNKPAQWNVGIYIFQVILLSPFYYYLFTGARAPLQW